MGAPLGLPLTPLERQNTQAVLHTGQEAVALPYLDFVTADVQPLEPWQSQAL